MVQEAGLRAGSSSPRSEPSVILGRGRLFISPLYSPRLKFLARGCPGWLSSSDSLGTRALSIGRLLHHLVTSGPSRHHPSRRAGEREDGPLITQASAWCPGPLLPFHTEELRGLLGDVVPAWAATSQPPPCKGRTA